MSTALSVLDAITLALFGAAGVLIYLIAVIGPVGKKWRLHKDRRPLGGPSLLQVIRARMKSEEPPIHGFAAVLTDEEMPSMRLLKAYRVHVASDTTPLIPRIPGVTMRRLNTIIMPVSAVLLAALAQVLPIVAFIASFVVLITAMTLRKKHLQPFAETHTYREQLILKAYNTVDPILKIGMGARAPYCAGNWLQVDEWTGQVPSTFRIMLPDAYIGTDGSRKALQDAWETNMSSRTSVSWGWEWHTDARYVLAKPFPALPTFAPLPFPADPEIPWNKIPLGINNRGSTVHWDAENKPHMIVMGRTNEGKSVQLNAILIDIAQDPFWSFYIADRKDALGTFMKADACAGFESSYEGILDMVRNIQAENERRKLILKENGKKKWYDLPEEILIDGVTTKRPPMIMLIVEEAIDLLAKTGIKEIDALKNELKGLLLQLIATSRSQGIQIIMVIQRPDAEFTGGAFRENINARVQVGPMGRSASNMLFETEVNEGYFIQDATLDEDGGTFKGRAAYSFSIGEYNILQGYFSKDDDEPLTRTLTECNAIRSGMRRVRRRPTPGEGPDPRLHPTSTPKENPAVRVLNKVAQKFGYRFEVVTVEGAIGDDEEESQGPRQSLKLRRISGQGSGSQSEPVRRRAIKTSGNQGRRSKVNRGSAPDTTPPPPSGERGSLREQVRARREAREGKTEPAATQTPETQQPTGLPIASFTDVTEPDVSEEEQEEQPLGTSSLPEPAPPVKLEDPLEEPDPPAPSGTAVQPEPEKVAVVSGVTQEGSWF